MKLNQWIPVISNVPQDSMVGPLMFILYTSGMFDLVEDNFIVYDAMLMNNMNNMNIPTHASNVTK